jgi:hypothetical protein
MNHQPFKDWLLSEERLEAEQAQALQQHLRECADCRQIESAWADAHALIQRAPDAAPVPGFTTRWQARLAARRLQEQRRQAWAAIAVTGGVAFLLLVLFGTQVLNLLSSPAQWLLLWVSRLTSLLSLYGVIQELFYALGQVTPAVPLIGLFFAVGFVSFLSVLWLATYRQLTTARRIIL